MNTRRRAPAASASSAAYWISGLSTTGSISLGLALVAGRNRVPRPATGNTAVLILAISRAWDEPGWENGDDSGSAALILPAGMAARPHRRGLARMRWSSGYDVGGAAGFAVAFLPLPASLPPFSTRILTRFCSRTLLPIPSTLSRSSADLNAPFFSRYSTIAWALAGPTPSSSLASVLASAVLMLTGPAHATTGRNTAIRLWTMTRKTLDMAASFGVARRSPNGCDHATTLMAGPGQRPRENFPSPRHFS